MISMVEETYLTHGSSPQYSAQFPRAGLAAMFSVEVVNITANTIFVVAIQDKTKKGTGWTTNASFADITTAGVFTKDVTGLNEMIRIQVTVAGTNTAGAVLARRFGMSPRPY